MPSAVEFVFVGSVDGFERPLVQAAGVPLLAYAEVQAGPLHGINPLRALLNLGKLAVGVTQALRLIAKHRPQAVLSTGGWVSFPVTVAAWLRRRPIVIYLPDIEPGLTIKALQRFATKVAATTEASGQFVPAQKLVVTGYPLRADLGAGTRAQAVAHFGLDPARKTLFVNGGSRGARSVNVALIDALPGLLARADLQVLHVTGELDAERSASQAAALDLTPQQRAHYHARAYLHDDMGLGFRAADLVLCRAGASILGELPYFGLPAVLIPYPYAWRYQRVNADYLADRGAALRLDDDRMAAELLPTLGALLDDDARLDQMADVMRALRPSRPAAEQIAALLAELAGGVRA